jgi:hypothetical protein
MLRSTSGGCQPTVGGMVDPDDLDREHTLRTAVARFEALRTRDSLAGSADDADSDAEKLGLCRGQVLELLALGSVIARKAGYGRQLSVRTAREAGASWAEIGHALGATERAAWEEHTRWIEEQAAQHHATGVEGLDDLQVARAKRRAGRPEKPQA